MGRLSCCLSVPRDARILENLSLKIFKITHDEFLYDESLNSYHSHIYMLARLWTTHLLFTAYEHWVWSSCVDPNHDSWVKIYNLCSVKSGILAVLTDTGGSENWHNRWTLMNMINDNKGWFIMLFICVIHNSCIHLIMWLWDLIMLPWQLLSKYKYAIYI